MSMFIWGMLSGAAVCSLLFVLSGIVVKIHDHFIDLAERPDAQTLFTKKWELTDER